MKTLGDMLKNIGRLLVVGLFLSSCGFSPIHKHNSLRHQLLKEIELQPIDSIEGVEFYNHFLSKFPKNHDNSKIKYILECSIKLDKGFNIVQSNSDILRQKLTIEVVYTVFDKTTKDELLNGKVSRFASYTVSPSPYSNYALNKNIINSLSIAAAEEVKKRIIHSLNKLSP